MNKEYVLQKDLPFLKAGTVYSKSAYGYLGTVDSASYLPNVTGMRHERFAIHRDWVEANPEWFKEKEADLNWFVVPTSQPSHSSIASWTAYKQRAGDMGGYMGSKYFDSEEAAIDYIIKHNPCLSLGEVWGLYCDKLDNSPKLWQALEELVKSKL